MPASIIPDYSDAFYAAFIKTMMAEGGYTNNPKDAGNWTGGSVGSGQLRGTKWGISAAAYPGEDIASLSLDRARELAHRDYWEPLRLDDVADTRIACELFDTGFNAGPRLATKFAQGALTLLGSPVEIDGVMGPETTNALNFYVDKVALLKLMNVLQGMYFLLGPGNFSPIVQMIKKRWQYSKPFLRGWMKRIEL